MSQKAYYCQLLLRNQISLVDVRTLQKKSKASIALVSPPYSPDNRLAIAAPRTPDARFPSGNKIGVW